MQRQRDDMQRRMGRRRKRNMQKRILTTFAVLALITAVGIAAALFASSRDGQEGRGADALAVDADVPKKGAQNTQEGKRQSQRLSRRRPAHLPG